MLSVFISSECYIHYAPVIIMGAMLDKRVAKLYSGVFLSVQYQQYKCYF